MFGDGQQVSFQLRWESDHLSAYVTVNDATVDATDAIELQRSTARPTRSSATEPATCPEW